MRTSLVVAALGVVGFAVVALVAAPRLAAPGALLDALPALLVVLSWTGFGALVLRAISAWDVLDRERWVWSPLAGLGVVGLVMQVLALPALHAFTSPVASIVTALGVGVLLLHARDFARDLAPADERGGAPGALFLAALAPAAALVVIRATAPPSFFDALDYHLGLPMQFAARGASFVDVHEMYSAVALLAEMAASPALLVDGPESFGFVYATEWFLVVAAVYVTARRVFPALPRVGGACAFAFASMPVIVFLPAGTKPDLVTALCAIGALRALARFADVDGPSRVPLFRFGALCLGLGCAAKTPFAAHAVVVALVTLFAGWRASRVDARARLPVREIVLGLVIAAIAGGFPMLRNAIAVHAPIYPFAGGPPWAEHTRALVAAETHKPHSLADVVAMPYSLSLVDDPTADELLGVVWWIGLAALAIARPQRVRALAWFAVVAALTVPVWFMTTALPRYDPFVTVALAFAAGVGLASIASVGRAARLVDAAAIVAGLLALQWNVVADDILLREPSAVLLQRMSRDAFIEHVLEPARAYRWLNEHARGGCALLLTGDPRIAYLEVPAITSEVYGRPWLDEIVVDSGSLDEALARIKALHATHVVVGKHAVQALQRRGWTNFDAAQEARFRALVDALGPPAYDDDIASVFALPANLVDAAPPYRCGA